MAAPIVPGGGTVVPALRPCPRSAREASAPILGQRSAAHERMPQKLGARNPRASVAGAWEDRFTGDEPKSTVRQERCMTSDASGDERLARGAATGIRRAGRGPWLSAVALLG